MTSAAALALITALITAVPEVISDVAKLLQSPPAVSTPLSPGDPRAARRHRGQARPARQMICRVGFSTSSWWVSRVIRFFTKAPVSHTYIVFEDPISPFGEEVYEAAWCGFRMSTRAKLTSGTTRIVREYLVALPRPESALGICRYWLECPYDYLGLVGEAWVQIGRLFGRRWSNPGAGPHHMFCSEAAAYLLQYCKVPWAAALSPRSTSPADLMAAFEAQCVDSPLLH